MNLNSHEIFYWMIVLSRLNSIVKNTSSNTNKRVASTLDVVQDDYLDYE